MLIMVDLVSGFLSPDLYGRIGDATLGARYGNS